MILISFILEDDLTPVQDQADAVIKIEQVEVIRVNGIQTSLNIRSIRTVEELMNQDGQEMGNKFVHIAIVIIFFLRHITPELGIDRLEIFAVSKFVGSSRTTFMISSHK